VISEDDTVPATAIADESYGRMLGSSSGVDIQGLRRTTWQRQTEQQ